MGKYMRKASKTTTTTSEPPQQMDHHYPSLGVRTRARTLALLQKKPLPTTPPTPSVDPTSYLQLRTRRLPKAPPFSQTKITREGHACKGSSNARINLPSCRSNKASCGGGNPKDAMDEVEASFGENDLEPETGERNLRETTPCSPIIKSGIATTPGSTTRRTGSSSTKKRIQLVENRTFASAIVIEQLFKAEEQFQVTRFREKYNYDPINDCPMPGRYDWTRVDM